MMSDMKIDLRYAAIPAGCTIEVRAFMSSVSLIVPPGLVVGFDVSPILGSARSDAHDGSHTAGLSHIQVHGSAIMSEVRVRVRQLGR
jgi:predicted membrane protein